MKLRVFENMVLRRIFRPRKNEVTGEWRLHNEELNDLYSSPIRATCPAHLILLHFIIRTILGEVKTFISSLCNLLQSPVTSSLLGLNILLNTMFSNTLSFLSSRNVSDQVSHPYISLLSTCYAPAEYCVYRKTSPAVFNQSVTCFVPLYCRLYSVVGPSSRAV